MREFIHVNYPMACEWQQVYLFASNPKNLPLWASGLAQSYPEPTNELHSSWNRWKLESPAGPITLDFAAPNPWGILDHSIQLGDGQKVYVPMRVIPLANHESLVVFTLFRQPGMSDYQFAADADWVRQDLQRLENQVLARLEKATSLRAKTQQS